MDRSKWFNAAWAIGYWTVLTAACVVGAVETHGVVRLLVAVAAIGFGMLLVYTVCALTIGTRWLHGVIARIEADRRSRK